MLATYDGNYYNGKPALTKNTVGKGTVYAYGSVFAEETAAALLELLPKAELCPVTGWLELPEEIELTVRTNEKNGRSLRVFAELHRTAANRHRAKADEGAAYTRNARRHIYHGALRRARAR